MRVNEKARAKQSVIPFRGAVIGRSLPFKAFTLMCLLSTTQIGMAASSGQAKIIRIQASDTAFYIRLEPTATLTFTCPGAGGVASNFATAQMASMVPVNDGAKAKLAIALEAFAMGRLVAFTTNSCTGGTTGYPIIEYLFMY